MSDQEMELTFTALPNKRRKKKIIVLALAGLLVVGGGIGVYAKVAAPKDTTANMRMFTVKRGDVIETVSASGTVQATAQVNLNFAAGNGKLTAVNVKVGDKVKAGQVLATLDNQAAQAQIANLKANLESAQARLAQAQEGATPEAIALQQASIQKAKLALDGAKTNYQDQLAIYNDRSQDSQLIVNAQNQVNQAQIQVKTAQANVDSANAKLAQAKEGPTAAQLYAAQEAVNAAKSQLSTAQQQLDLGGSSSQYLSNTNAIHQAEAAVANAENNLAQLQQGTDANVLAQDQAAVTQAQASLQQAQASLNAAQQNYNTTVQNYSDRTSAKAQLDQAKNNVDQAQASYDQAVAQLNQLQAPPDPNAIAEAQAAVDQAQAQLQQQQQTLNNYVIKAPIDGVVTQVNGHPGEMTNATTSSSTSAIGPGLIVIDDSNSKDLQVMAQVSQTDIGKIKSGMSVSCTTSTYQNKTFNGKVLMVYPEATTSSGVTTYNVLMSVDNSEGLLKPGMTTNVTIQVGDHQNVLYVPSMALKEINGQDGVMVEANGSANGSSQQQKSARNFNNSSNNSSNTNKNNSNSNGSSRSNRNSSAGVNGAKLQFQPVQIGYYSSDKVEITSGLKEGEQVAVTYQSSTSSNNRGSGGNRGFGGGGFGGGGFGGGRGN